MSTSNQDEAAEREETLHNDKLVRGQSRNGDTNTYLATSRNLDS
jgi:hypothetical protein